MVHVDQENDYKIIRLADSFEEFIRGLEHESVYDLEEDDDGLAGRDTLELSELVRVMMEYLDCECTYFPAMKDDDPIMSAYSHARRLGVREGFIPVLVKADEILWECLVMNSDPGSDGAAGYSFDPEKVAEYRKKALAASIKEGEAVLEELVGQRREEAEDDDVDWKEDILGEMEGGYENCRFSSYWDSNTDMTCPLILAKIPVKNPWEIFLPICPLAIGTNALIRWSWRLSQSIGSSGMARFPPS